uniref:F-box domain-containing protein n=1 Tax=Setaria viridis TaxID=4556 RepID=A0A4U6TIM2_SETVI|nr:hypothetical protein SEVIR_8G234000v2 [Setaria viridis]
METHAAMARALPDDLLADVLARLPLRSLAVSQCVCKAWRALTDEHRLLLPRWVRSLFIHYGDYRRPHFFACRETSVEHLAECQEGAMSSIGRSGNGVCFAALNNMTQLRVWTLNESGDEPEWLLKHDSVVITKYEKRRCDGPWTIDATRDYYDSETEDDEVSQEDNRDWNSDGDDNIIDTADENDCFRTSVSFLGFHPYKEVIFLRDVGNSAVAYHLNSTKVHYLGELNPGCYNHGLFDSFVYTPCLMNF